MPYTVQYEVNNAEYDDLNYLMRITESSAKDVIKNALEFHEAFKVGMEDEKNFFYINPETQEHETYDPFQFKRAGNRDVAKHFELSMDTPAYAKFMALCALTEERAGIKDISQEEVVIAAIKSYRTVIERWEADWKPQILDMVSGEFKPWPIFEFPAPEEATRTPSVPAPSGISPA